VNIKTGTIKFFCANEGFALITADEDGSEIFVERSVIRLLCLVELRPGLRVCYVPVTGLTGDKATEIRILLE
jgi:cold shock CspA family protein